MTYKLNGKVLRPGRPFVTDSGDQYPGDWLAASTQEQRDALGIVFEVDAPKVWYDRRYYWGPNQPKDLEVVRTRLIEEQRERAQYLLNPTDWYVLRRLDEPAAEYPAEVSQFRSLVRAVSNTRISEIESCTSVDELVLKLETLTDWPSLS